MFIRYKEKYRRVFAASFIFFCIAVLIKTSPSYLLCAPTLENYKYFSHFQSLVGYTGGIINPNCGTVGKKRVSLGLNKFNVGVLYGLTNNIETGLHFNLKQLTPFTAFDDENFRRKADEISIDSKIKIFSEDDYGFDMALGHRRSVIYWVAERYFPGIYDITISGGFRVYYNGAPSEKTKLFFTLTQTQEEHRFVYDYDDSVSSQNIGWRFLLSPDVSFDVFVIDFTRYRNFFENVYFGVSVIWI